MGLIKFKVKDNLGVLSPLTPLLKGGNRENLALNKGELK